MQIGKNTHMYTDCTTQIGKNTDYTRHIGKNVETASDPVKSEILLLAKTLLHCQHTSPSERRG